MIVLRTPVLLDFVQKLLQLRNKSIFVPFQKRARRLRLGNPVPAKEQLGGRAYEWSADKRYVRVMQYLTDGKDQDFSFCRGNDPTYGLNALHE